MILNCLGLRPLDAGFAVMLAEKSGHLVRVVRLRFGVVALQRHFRMVFANMQCAPLAVLTVCVTCRSAARLQRV